MAGGPIFPQSAVPDSTGDSYPIVYSGDGGGTSVLEQGLGVAASIGADVTWHLRFQMPPSLPTGTCKLRLLVLADAITGNAKVNPKWKSIAVGEDPSAQTLTAETVQTKTWSTDDDDEYQEVKVTLDADTVVASEIIAMALVFETSSWTLAVESCWIPSVIWE